MVLELELRSDVCKVSALQNGSFPQMVVALSLISLSLCILLEIEFRTFCILGKYSNSATSLVFFIFNFNKRSC